MTPVGFDVGAKREGGGGGVPGEVSPSHMRSSFSAVVRLFYECIYDQLVLITVKLYIFIKNYYDDFLNYIKSSSRLANFM
jgi:hypothetical protein